MSKKPKCKCECSAPVTIHYDAELLEAIRVIVREELTKLQEPPC